MKNVLIVAINGMGNSGVPNVICQVINSQYKTCHFSLMVFEDDDFYYPFLLERNVDIIKINLPTPNTPLKKLLWYFFQYPHFLKINATKIIKDRKIDIIHSFKEEDGWPILEVGRQLGVKIRITHCNNEYRKRIGLFPQLIFLRNRRRMLKFSNLNVGVSKKCCLTKFGNKPYTIIYNSYDESRFSQRVRCRLREKLVLTHVATFSERKNQLFSIDILEALILQGIECRLNLVGFSINKNYFDDMLKTIKSKNLDRYITIIDGREGIGNIFEETSFLLLPSVSEAAPIVLVEAQACGIRCFASNTITNEMNCGGVTYLPIDKGASPWADAIVDAFSLYKNNRTFFNMERFSSKTFSKEISKLYRL